MKEEERLKLEKAKKRLRRIDRCRLFFLFVAVVLLLFLFWGAKLWEEAQWFTAAREKLYRFLSYDIALLAAASFAKLFAAMLYNRMVKKLQP